MMLKIIGMGFIFTEKAYLKDSMNILDISIVISAWIPIFFEGSSSNLKVFRIFRVLRPFKTVKNIKALRQLIQAIISAIPLLKDILIILLFFEVVFALVGL